jgi:hypothetical protein
VDPVVTPTGLDKLVTVVVFVEMAPPVQEKSGFAEAKVLTPLVVTVRPPVTVAPLVTVLEVLNVPPVTNLPVVTEPPVVTVLVVLEPEP